MLIKYNRACRVWVYVLVLHLGKTEGSHSRLMEFDAVHFGRWLSTFMRDLLPPFFTLKMDDTVLSHRNHLQDFTMSLILRKLQIFNTVKTSAGTRFDPWTSQTQITSNVTVFWNAFCWKITSVLDEPRVLTLSVKVKVKVNQSRYRPGVAQRVPGS